VSRPVPKARGIYEHPDRKGEWWIQFFDVEGKRRRETGGTRSAAIELLAIRKAAKIRGEKLPPNLRTGRVTYDHLIDDALEHSRAENSPDSPKELALKYAIIRLELGSKAAIDLKRQDLVRYLTRLGEERNWSDGTWNRWLAALSLPFRVGIQNERVDRNPASGIKRKQESNGRIRFLSTQEEAELRAIILRRCPHNLPAFLISCHTGMRSSEQFSMTWDQLSFERALLTLPKTKPGTYRHVPVNEVALDAFRELRAASGKDHIFENRRGDQLRGHRDWFDPILAEAKLTGGYTWHCNRHTFASRLVMAGVDMRTLGELMGHSSMEMTRRYTHLSQNYLASAVARLVAFSDQSATTTATSASVIKQEPVSC